MRRSHLDIHQNYLKKKLDLVLYFIGVLLIPFNVSCIQNMLTLCLQHVHDFLICEEENRMIKLELLNREESYNKIFGNTPKIK